MKNISISLIIIIFSVIFSCKKEENTTKPEKEFEFTITGKVKNGEGIEIALFIPSKSLDNRITSVIKDGKYMFKGKANKIEKAEIRFEENIINESNSYAVLEFFIEPDTLQFNFTIDGKSPLHYFTNIKVIKGPNNQYYYDVAPVISKNFGTTFFSDSIKNDSMHRYVYPNIKKNAFKVFDSLFSNTKFNVVNFSYLNYVIDGHYGPFQIEHINKKEKEQINKLFSQIDTSLASTFGYKKFKKYIDKLNDPNISQSFKDYKFLDIENKKVKLSDIIKNNKYTVLYFWYSGCGICRNFNQKTTPEIYNKLKKKGIEIVSINTDASQKYWRKNSKKDSIIWSNLYAGSASDAILHYNVEGYPKKIIFDKNFNIINYEFKTAFDLLNIENNKKTESSH